MEVVVNNYLPGDQRLVDKIVYELKAQGIFDQFRKECFADVDTKPAYQNLRQRVENNVTGFLREQSWRPDMNKNQVREMLRKRITESGYLEKGVERIVDQVVNPKINSVFLPKVEEVIYKYLGIEKPNHDNKPSSNQDTNDDKNDSKPTVEPSDLLPQDLEAVSPESEPIDKKDEKTNSNDSNTQDLDDNKMEEDESPPFEPLEEQSVYNPQEENSIDSHMSGFSGLISHESNVSSDTKAIVIDLNQQDSQMSRNSSESHLSIITSDDNNSKMDICGDDSQSKSIKSTDSNSKIDDNNKINKIDKTIKQKPDNNNKKDDKDRERERKSSTGGSKDSKSRHSSLHSSRDKDRNREHKSGGGSSSSSSNKNDKDRSRDKDKKSTSSSKHSSKDKERNCKESSSRDRDKDKNRSTSSHHDKDARKSGDSTKKSRKDDKSSSTHSSSDRYKKDKEKDRKKDSKSKDDHYSSRDRKNDRRSNDRDSNGSSTSANNNNNSNNNNDQSNKQSNDSSTQSSDFKNSNSGDSNNSGNSEQKDEIEGNKLKLSKPKFASNIKEAMKLMKIRKQLAKLEKQNQLSLSSVDVNTTTLLSSSICLDEVKKSNGLLGNNDSMTISQDNWDRMEAKLNQQIVDDDDNDYCKYFENDVNDVKNSDFVQFVDDEIGKFDEYCGRFKSNKRKYHNINNNNQLDYCVKRRKLDKQNHNSSHIIQQTVESFPLPLSPAESDNSLDRKEATPPLKPKRNYSNKSNNQRYSSEDLYKPRLTFISSRRRGTRPLDN